MRRLLIIALVVALSVAIALLLTAPWGLGAQETLPTLPEDPLLEPTPAPVPELTATPVWAATVLAELRGWRADVNAAATATASAPTPTAEPARATSIALVGTSAAHWATALAPTPSPAPAATPAATPAPLPWPPTPGPACGLSHIVDLDRDSAEVLAALPYDAHCQGLGLYTALRIVQHRGAIGYRTAADLLRVPGITPEIVEAIRACACTVQR